MTIAPGTKTSIQTVNVRSMNGAQEAGIILYRIYCTYWEQHRKYNKKRWFHDSEYDLQSNEVINTVEVTNDYFYCSFKTARNSCWQFYNLPSVKCRQC